MSKGEKSKIGKVFSTGLYYIMHVCYKQEEDRFL